MGDLLQGLMIWKNTPVRKMRGDQMRDVEKKGVKPSAADKVESQNLLDGPTSLSIFILQTYPIRLNSFSFAVT